MKLAFRHWVQIGVTALAAALILPATAATAAAQTACTCTGDGANGSVTVSCGQTTCGADLKVYSCTSAGWASTGYACGEPADASPPASNCTCEGPMYNGSPYTIACGQSACIYGDVYYCDQPGWFDAQTACNSGVPAPGTSSSSTGGCSCSGTGIDGPVTVACGASTCGQDSTTYSCSSSGWSSTGQACTGSCSCSGVGMYGNVTVSCGQTTCGQDGITYQCNADAWVSTGTTCGADAGPPPCTCSGTGLNGAVTVSCGGSTCGTDHMTYSCSSSGWAPTGTGC